MKITALDIVIEQKSYHVSLNGNGDFVLTKADLDAYTVTITESLIRCTCPAFKFGQGLACKHISACRQVGPLLTGMSDDQAIALAAELVGRVPDGVERIMAAVMPVDHPFALVADDGFSRVCCYCQAHFGGPAPADVPATHITHGACPRCYREQSAALQGGSL